MKTKIIIGEGWKEIAEYDFLIPLDVSGYVSFEDREYKVQHLMLDIDANCLEIVIKCD